MITVSSTITAAIVGTSPALGFPPAPPSEPAPTPHGSSYGLSIRTPKSAPLSSSLALLPSLRSDRLTTPRMLTSDHQDHPIETRY